MSDEEATMKKLITMTACALLLMPLSVQVTHADSQSYNNVTNPDQIKVPTQLSDDEIRAQLSDDFLTLYEIERDNQMSGNGAADFTLQEFIALERVAFYDENEIWNSTETVNDYTGVFVGRDLKGIELFSNLSEFSLMLVGPQANYNFEPLQAMTSQNVSLTIGYEPKLLSDHAMAPHFVTQSFLYDETLEQDLVSYLNAISDNIMEGTITDLHLGHGMSHLPRMFDYSWLKGFFNKGVGVTMMEQRGPLAPYLVSYTIRYIEADNKYALDFEMDNPYKGVVLSGNQYETVDYFPNVYTHEADMFDTLIAIDSDGNTFDLKADDGQGIDKLAKVQGTLILDDVKDQYYDEDGLPYSSGPYNILPTRIMGFGMDEEYMTLDVDGQQSFSFINSEVSMHMDLPLYVDFESNPNGYNVDTSDFTAQSLHQLVRNGELLEKPNGNEVQSDYVLEGWYFSPTFESQTKWDFDTDVVSHNVTYFVADDADTPYPERTPATLYANWVPIANYATVKFESNGGSAVENQLILKQTVAIEPKAPTQSGYAFAGWYADEALTTPWDFTTPITDDTTLYAKWDKVAVNYTVSFESNGGNDIESQTVLENTVALKPTDPTQSGYTFVGWYADEALTTPWDFTTPITDDTTLYAKWDKVAVNYTVSFESNGGSDIESQTVLENTVALKPTDPTQSGYTFAGWYADEALTTPWDFTTPITKDTTLYAKWEYNESVTPIDPEDPAIPVEPTHPVVPETLEAQLPQTGMNNMMNKVGLTILTLGIGLSGVVLMKRKRHQQ